MVKPPKSMEPEAINLKKAGRDSTKAFGEDSFRNYMGRKIDMQRQQFGLVLPPPPDGSDRSDTCSHSKGSMASQDRKRSLTFDKSSNNADGRSASSKASSKKRKKKLQFGITKVLKRLKKKHGDTSKRTHGETKTRDGILPPTDLTSPKLQALRKDLTGSPSEVTNNERNMDEVTPCSVKKRRDLFFLGVVVIVNGYTNPDTETLQRLLHRHGGDLEKYETSRVTHIIAESLSTAKANIYKRQKRPRPVCKPSWITDCVAAGKLLPASRYLIDEVKGDGNNGIRSVVGFLGRGTGQEVRGSKASVSLVRSEAGSCTAEATVDHHECETEKKVNNEISSPYQGVRVDNQEALSDPPSTGLGEKEHMRPAEEDADCREFKNKTANNNEVNSPYQGVIVDRQDATPGAQLNRVDLEGGPRRLEKNDRPHTDSGPTIDKPMPQIDSRYINGRVRTVGTDPHFLESFFAASRLSFIGSYKQRAKQSPTKQKLQKKKNTKRFVFHVDLDSFFASVVLRNYPDDYRDKPVAISHHGEKKGARNSDRHIPVNSSSECATCNYEARKYGIKKGMFLGQARKLCPDLIVLQYDFEGYEEVSEAVTDILDRHAEEFDGFVEHVSCDEAYVEFHIPCDSDHSAEDVAGEIAESIRKEIYKVTRCTASVGVAKNKFIAKLATDHVKPNGSFVAKDHISLLRPLQLKQLHGIGYRLNQRLEESGLVTVEDLWDMGQAGESELCRILGPGLGKKIYGFCNGIDDRSVQPAERKTIGAECNYGVRFDGPYGVDHMIEGLCKEVESRMERVGVQGSRLTLKVKQRKEGARAPPKFLGHGSCHNVTRSGDIGDGKVTRNWKTMKRVSLTLFESMKVPTDDVRGMGIVVSKLAAHNGATSAIENRSQRRISALFAAHPNAKDSVVVEASFKSPQKLLTEDCTQMEVWSQSPTNPSEANAEEHADFSDIALPPLSQIHMSQVKALPVQLRYAIESRMTGTGNETEKPMVVAPLDTSSAVRFRQTNMKRMLKLASVKSKPGDVSLTQLESLPLEMQLQIVNEDKLSIGQLSPSVKRGQTVTAKPNKRTKKLIGKKPNPEAVEPPEVEPPSDPSEFYNTNMRPFQHFLDESSVSDPEAKQRVIDFLLLCLSEDRLPDVVVFLRCIWNRCDEWSREFDAIFEAVDERVKGVLQYGLDREWIQR